MCLHDGRVKAVLVFEQPPGLSDTVDDFSFVRGAGIPLGSKAGLIVEDLLDEVFLVVRVDLCGDTLGRVLAGSVFAGSAAGTLHLTITDTKTGETFGNDLPWGYDPVACP